MNKGDLFSVYLDGSLMTLCILGFYSEEHSGEEMVILAVVSQENMLHIPLDDLQAFFPKRKFLN